MNGTVPIGWSTEFLMTVAILVVVVVIVAILIVVVVVIGPQGLGGIDHGVDLPRGVVVVSYSSSRVVVVVVVREVGIEEWGVPRGVCLRSSLHVGVLSRFLSTTPTPTARYEQNIVDRVEFHSWCDANAGPTKPTEHMYDRIWYT